MMKWFFSLFLFVCVFTCQAQVSLEILAPSKVVKEGKYTEICLNVYDNLEKLDSQEYYVVWDLQSFAGRFTYLEENINDCLFVYIDGKTTVHSKLIGSEKTYYSKPIVIDVICSNKDDSSPIKELKHKIDIIESTICDTCKIGN